MKQNGDSKYAGQTQTESNQEPAPGDSPPGDGTQGWSGDSDGTEGDAGRTRRSTEPEPEARSEKRVRVQLEVRPALIVGVGGTGCLAVKRIKERMLEISHGRSVPFIRYVVIDTTAQDPSLIRLDHGEFANIGQMDFNDIVQNRGDYPHLDYWFPDHKFKPMQLGLGAMGVRHIGRLCYFQYRESPKVRDMFLNRIRDLMNPSLPDQIRELGYVTDLRVDQTIGIDVHIIGSGSGGTGSGMFLDLAYDIRRWAKTHARSARVIGHLMLPDAFEGVIPEPVMPQAVNNAFCLLAEIDHFIDKGKWSVRYKSETVASGETPFDFIYLLGRKGTDGAVRSRDELIRQIGSVVACLCTTPVGKDLMDSAVNLVPPILSNNEPKYNKPCPYSSYGISVGEADPQEIAREAAPILMRRVVERVFRAEFAARADETAEGFLAEQVSWETIVQKRPQRPVVTVTGQTPRAAVPGWSLQQKALTDGLEARRKEWEGDLGYRFEQIRGDAFQSRIHRMIRSSGGSGPVAWRIGDLPEFVRCIKRRLSALRNHCNDAARDLEESATEANARIQVLQRTVPQPADWEKRFAEASGVIAEDIVTRPYYEWIAKEAEDTANALPKELEYLAAVEKLLLDRLDKQRHEPELPETPKARFATAAEVLSELFGDLRKAEKDFRREIARLLADKRTDPADYPDELLRELERIVGSEIEVAMVPFKIGARLNLDEVAAELARNHGDADSDRFDLLAKKLQTMHLQAQPAFRCVERFDKEKVVYTGRVGAKERGPIAGILEQIDNTIRAKLDDPSDVVLARFVYGAPLWAVEGAEEWERVATQDQSNRGMTHNFLDRAWGEFIDSPIPKLTEKINEIWFFTMLSVLKRIRFEGGTWWIDESPLPGTENRRQAFDEFKRRFGSVLDPQQIESDFHRYLKQVGGLAEQVRHLERHLRSLERMLVVEVKDPDADRRVPTLLRDEIAVVRKKVSHWAKQVELEAPEEPRPDEPAPPS